MSRRVWYVTAVALMVFVTAALVVLPSVLSDESSAASEKHFYLDENSDIHHEADSMSVSLAAGGILTTGYWHAEGIISVPTLTISGDVKLILRDDTVLTVSGGVAVPAGSSLSLYPESRAEHMGKLYASVNLTGGTIKNVAFMEYTNNTLIVTSTSGPVANYGMIKATGNTSNALYSTAAITVNNNRTDFCFGTVTSPRNCINVGGGSTVNNSGVLGTPPWNTTSVSVFIMGSNAVVNNYKEGVMESYGNCVILGSGGILNNYGEINGKVDPSNPYGGVGVFGVSANLTVNNFEGAKITVQGYVNAVQYMGTGNVLNNYGELSSPATTVYLSGGGATIDNYGTIKGIVGIQGITADFNNYGIIETVGYGVFFSGVTNVKNEGTISNKSNSGIAVYLSTNTAGSTITNSGTIESTFPGGIAVQTSAACTIVNTADGVIYGESFGLSIRGGSVTNNGIISSDSYGIYLNASAATTLVNNNLIKGSVNLSNLANDVTLKAGSRIEGNFNIGTGASNLRFTGTPGPSLVYATVTGSTAGIGSSTTVHIDYTALPAVAVGTVLTLIDIQNTGTVTGTPANPSATFGGYDVTMGVVSSNLIATIAAVNHAISLKNTANNQPLDSLHPYTFTSANPGYGTQTPLNVTVTNLGSYAGGTGPLRITLNGTGASNFTLSTTSLAGIAVGGTATFTVTPVIGLMPGTYTATVTVGVAAGNTNPIAPVSFVVSFTVNKFDSTTVAESSPSPSVFGQTVTLKATVTGYAGTPSGTVIFSIGATQIGSAVLNASGVATITVNDLPVGSDTVVASYQGNGLYNGSSDAVIHIVIPADTQTTIASDLNPSYFGQMVKFTATVTSLAPGSGTPSGRVEFFENGRSIGSSMLTASGTATVFLGTLSVGSHPVTAVYQGNTNYNGSSSAILTQVVLASDGPVHYITAIPDAGSIITPPGVNIVPRGINITFTFSAKPGYTLTEVWIDRLHLLTPEEMALGTYTFTNVMANHTIEAKSVAGARTDVTVRIDVMEGSGKALYSLDDIDYIEYEAPLTLPIGSDLWVIAVPDSGYRFVRWDTPEESFNPEIAFVDLRGSLHLEVYFEVDDAGKIGSIVWLLIVLLIIAGLILLLFLLRIRPGLFLTIMMGSPVENASVTYRIDDDKTSKNDIDTTNSKGKLRIAAKKGSVVTITMAAKDGRIAKDLPITVRMDNRREYLNMILK